MHKTLYNIDENGRKWYRRGREDFLEYEWPDGAKEFYRGREDRLSFQSADGTKYYYTDWPEDF